MIGSVLGYPVELVIPANVSNERKIIINAYGAKVTYSDPMEGSDGAIRLAALDALQNAPETALSFGPYEKRDLVDVLLSQAERFRGELEWLSWIGALAA